MLRVYALFTVVVALASGTTASAQTTDGSTSSDGSGEIQGQGQMRDAGLSDEQARSHFRIGQALYSEGRFAEAGAEFQRAYMLSNRGPLLYNAYVAYRDANDLEHAIVVLTEYLRVTPPSDDTVVLERRLAAMQRTYESQLSTQTSVESERARLEQERARLEQEAADARARADAAEREVERRNSPVPFVVGGSGLALLAGAGVAAIIANGNISDAEAQCPDHVCPRDVSLGDVRASVRRPAITADVLLGAGTVTLVTGVVMLIVRRGGGDADEAPPVAATCDGTGCRGSYTLRF